MGINGGRKPVAWVLAVLVALASVLLLAAPVAAGEDRQQHQDVRILSDHDFTAANGVVDGSGTAADPYVISGWSIRNLTIKDTASHVIIRDNDITSRLVLDWNGPGVTVVNNTVRDLRVNQNVKRTGAATGGYIANNKFGTVGQLRHFDGIFEKNVVRPSPGVFDSVFGEPRAVNFDGFNGSKFRNNTLYGYMDVRLHGHHHGSSYDDESHYHGATHDHATHGSDGGDMDHTKRFHEVWVTNNTIYSSAPYALRYTDSAHSANDRTAASEQNQELNKPHVHYTRVHLTNNELIGSGLSVNIFNADDRNHTGTERGALEIAGNRITVHDRDHDAFSSGAHGIDVWDATDVDLTIARNVITGVNKESLPSHRWLETQGAGIYMQEFNLANVYITDNRVIDLVYGVAASRFSESVEWWISGLSTQGVQEAVAYDSSVKNQPRRRP